EGRVQEPFARLIRRCAFRPLLGRLTIGKEASRSAGPCRAAASRGAAPPSNDRCKVPVVALRPWGATAASRRSKDLLRPKARRLVEDVPSANRLGSRGAGSSRRTRAAETYAGPEGVSGGSSRHRPVHALVRRVAVRPTSPRTQARRPPRRTRSPCGYA